jgi:hypothetical protein
MRRLRCVVPPAEPLQGLAEVLEVRGPELLALTVRSVYVRGGQGWFALGRARPRLDGWMDALHDAARRGRYQGAAEESRALVKRALIGGCSLLECHLFVERFGLTLQQALKQGGDADAQAGTLRLFTALRHELLREMG